MKRWKDPRGFSLMEPLMIIVIFSIFGFTAFSLIQAGDGAYRRITDNFNTQSGARIAMGYIQNRLCQNDREGAVSVVSNPLGEGNAIRIADGGSAAAGYDIWILWEDGVLLEFYGSPGAEPVREYCFEILSISGFEVTAGNGGQTVEVSVPYVYSGNEELLTRSFPLKTLQTGGGTP